MQVTPHRHLTDLVLTGYNGGSIEALVREHGARERLRARGLEPRHRLLLHGPPSTGKTSLAGAIAAALDVPLLAVRYDAVVNSYRGKTAQHLRQLFNLVRPPALCGVL